MKKVILLYIALVFLTISCKQNSEEKTIVKLQEKKVELSLVGKVISYAPSLDSLTNEVYAECDCCSGNYLFINKTEFLNIDYCESDNTYLKGKYEIKNGNIILKFDPIAVEKNYNWEKETDTTGTIKTDYLYKKAKIEAFTKTLTLFKNKKNLCFTTDEKDIPYAAIDKNLKIESLLKEIKRDSIWNKLEME